MYKLLLLLLPLFVVNISYAQKYEQRADKFYKYYNYEKARKDYIRVWRKDKDNVDLLKKIIDCYLSDNTLREEALPYIDRLIELKPNNYEAQLNKVTALFHAHRFNDAKLLLQKINPSISSNAELSKKAATLKANIANAEQLMATPLDVELINLGKNINTNRNDVSPYVSASEQQLFYSTDKRYNSYAGIYFYNICVSEKVNLNFEKGKTIGSQLNSIYDEMVAGITPDGSQLFAFHNREGDETMGYAEYKGNYRFEPLANFGPPLDARGSEYGMWMTSGNDTILFSSENEAGNTDLYYAIKLPTGEWGEARLLAGKVNSSLYNENFPVLSKDGQRLYFSSDNEHSMGGYDIFFSNWDKEKKEWGQPINMGYPINDTYNNYNISWVDGERFAYISSIKPQGLGKYDIYKVVFKNTTPYDAVIKCELRIKKDRRIRKPDFVPVVSVTDTLNNLIGTYNVNADSANFVLALTAGTYQIHIDHDQIEPFAHELIIPDNKFYSVADRIRLILVAKQEEK